MNICERPRTHIAKRKTRPHVFKHAFTIFRVIQNISLSCANVGNFTKQNIKKKEIKTRSLTRGKINIGCVCVPNKAH